MINAENPPPNAFLIDRLRVAANIKEILERNRDSDTVRIPGNKNQPTFPFPKSVIYAMRYAVWKDLIGLGLDENAAYNVIGVNPKTAERELAPSSTNP